MGKLNDNLEIFHRFTDKNQYGASMGLFSGTPGKWLQVQLSFPYTKVQISQNNKKEKQKTLVQMQNISKDIS